MFQRAENRRVRFRVGHEQPGSDRPVEMFLAVCWEELSAVSTHARLQALDIWGKEWLEDIPHDDSKHFRPTDKNVPQKLDDAVAQWLQMENSPHWDEELEKAQVYAGGLSNFELQSVARPGQYKF